jgi:hypothetical protein
MAKNLFAKATTKKAPKKSKTDKRIVNISGKEFAKKLQEYAILKDQLDDIKASFAMAQSEIKTRGIEEYAKLVNLLPVYYYNFSFREADIDYLNNSKFKNINLRIEKVKKVNKDFSLYRLVGSF